jgi:hypothetical protein
MLGSQEMPFYWVTGTQNCGEEPTKNRQSFCGEACSSSDSSVSFVSSFNPSAGASLERSPQLILFCLKFDYRLQELTLFISQCVEEYADQDALIYR